MLGSSSVNSDFRRSGSTTPNGDAMLLICREFAGYSVGRRGKATSGHSDRMIRRGVDWFDGRERYRWTSPARHRRQTIRRVVLQRRKNQAFGPDGGLRSTIVVCDPAPPVPTDGSRIFVRLVALSTPIPISTIMPTAIHVPGTFSKYAASASPAVRMMNPMRYDAKEDMVSIQSRALRMSPTASKGRAAFAGHLDRAPRSEPARRTGGGSAPRPLCTRTAVPR